MNRILLALGVAQAACCVLASPVTVTPAYTRVFPGQTVDLVAACPAGLHQPKGAAVQVTWSILGAQGGTLAGEDPWRRTFIAPMVKDHARAGIKVKVRRADGTLIGKATALVEVVQDPGLAEVLRKTLMPSAAGQGWLADRPSLSFLADVVREPPATGANLPVPAEQGSIFDMTFVDDPALGDLDRTVLLLTSSGLYGLSLRHQGLVPGPAVPGDFGPTLQRAGVPGGGQVSPAIPELARVAVRPPGSSKDNPHHAVFLARRATKDPSSGTLWLWTLGADGVVRPWIDLEKASLDLQDAQHLAMDRQGRLYVGTSTNLYRIAPDGACTRFPEPPKAAGARDGEGSEASLQDITALVYHPEEDCLYCVGIGSLRRVTLAGEVSTVFECRPREMASAVPAPGEVKAVPVAGGEWHIQSLTPVGPNLILTLRDLRAVRHPKPDLVVAFQPATGLMEGLVTVHPAERREGPVGAHSREGERGNLPAPVRLITASPEGSCFLYLKETYLGRELNRPGSFAHLDLASFATVPAAAKAAPAAARPKEPDERKGN